MVTMNCDTHRDAKRVRDSNADEGKKAGTDPQFDTTPCTSLKLTPCVPTRRRGSTFQEEGSTFQEEGSTFQEEGSTFQEEGSTFQ